MMNSERTFELKNVIGDTFVFTEIVPDRWALRAPADMPLGQVVWPILDDCMELAGTDLVEVLPAKLEGNRASKMLAAVYEGVAKDLMQVDLLLDQVINGEYLEKEALNHDQNGLKHIALWKDGPDARDLMTDHLDRLAKIAKLLKRATVGQHYRAWRSAE